MGNSVISRSIKNQKIVSNVKLEEYQGLWYEIARKPAFFEDKNARNVTAQYTLLGSNQMEVINTEEVKGKQISKRGVATVVNAQTNSQLSVKFDGVLFSGQYWIVRLGGDERDSYDFAVVSMKGGKYLWILSRYKTCSHLNWIIQNLKEEGYNLDDLIFTPQD